MSKKYHVSSLTGVPGICRAKDGNCPYGGESGQENHYDTFGEAQKASQRLYRNDHDILPDSNHYKEPGYDAKIKQLFEEIQQGEGGLNEYSGSQSEWDNEVDNMLNSIDEELGDNVPEEIDGDEDVIKRLHKDEWAEIANILSELESTDSNRLSEQKIRYEVRTTEDTDLIESVIAGDIYLRNDWSTIGAALQNPNLPRDFIDDVFNNPENYHIETQRWLALNPALTHEEIITLVEERDDLKLRSIALMNDSLEKGFAEDFLKNRSDELYKLPWYNMMNNPELGHGKLFREFIVMATITKQKTDELEAIKINDQYKDWKRAYE